jgi:hypothetical protein
MSWPYPNTGIGLAWVALFVFDLLIFVLTVYKICKTRGLPRLSLMTRRNIIDIIFQDGKSFAISVLWTLNDGTQVRCISGKIASEPMIRSNLIRIPSELWHWLIYQTFWHSMWVNELILMELHGAHNLNQSSSVRIQIRTLRRLFPDDWQGCYQRQSV